MINSFKVRISERKLNWYLVTMLLCMMSVQTAASTTEHSGPVVELKTIEAINPGDFVDIEVIVSWEGTPCLHSMGGYTLVVMYDSNALVPYDVLPDSLPGECAWEPLRYDIGNPFCDTCPQNVLRITGEVDLNYTENICLWPTGRMFCLRFLTANNANLHDSSVSIDFYWRECHDNIFWTAANDTILLGETIFDEKGYDITDYTQSFPAFTGPHSNCVDLLQIEPTAILRSSVFSATRVEFLPWQSSNLDGDLDGNGTPFEIDDFTIFRNFFIYGDSAFLFNPGEQIRTTDIDLDGTDTTLADLVIMYNTMNGHSSPSPSENIPQATFEYEEGSGILTVSIEANSPIGAYNIWMGTSECEIYYVTFMDFIDPGNIGEHFYHIGSDNLSVLFLDGSPSTPAFDSGTNVLFKVYYSGSSPTILIERVASSDGKLFSLQAPTDIITESTDNRLLPTFSLHQNYPNPFNPSTTIRFDLRERCSWQIKIVNINGQNVADISGVDGPGPVELWWDSRDNNRQCQLASGVYYYCLRTPTYSETRKMVLLK